jgi:hypothetical protein
VRAQGDPCRGLDRDDRTSIESILGDHQAKGARRCDHLIEPVAPRAAPVTWTEAARADAVTVAPFLLILARKDYL